MNDTHVVVESQRVMKLSDTEVTRSYPFTRKTVNQIQDLRRAKEDAHYDLTGEDVMVPAPVVIAEAIDDMHAKYFPEEHQE